MVKGPAGALVKEGGQVVLECVVKGKPYPSITWMLNGESVQNDSHIITSGKKLYFTLSRLSRIY